MGLTVLRHNEGILSLERKKELQQMLSEADGAFRQTIHSICKIIEVWDRFSNRDAAYLSDILRPTGHRTHPIPPYRMFATIGDHINSIRDLRHRAEEQKELCTGLAHEVSWISLLLFGLFFKLN